MLRAERTAAADFLLALADFDRRRGWEPLGHASLFAFLRAELRLSSGAAFWRMSAARLLQRFPDLIEPLRDGRLCLSTTAELAKVLTEENRAEVLPRFFGLSAREAKEVVAELHAARGAAGAGGGDQRGAIGSGDPSAVQRCRARPELAPARVRQGESVGVTEPVAFRTSETELASPARAPDRRDEVEPLTADLRRLHVTVDRQFLKQLDVARDGLSHSIPGATHRAGAEGRARSPRGEAGAGQGPGEAAAKGRSQPQADRDRDPDPDLDRRRRPRPRLTSTSTADRLHRRAEPREHIPASVRRAVWERDQDRCVWPLDGGGVCGSTHRLEIDHRLPHGLGGQPELGNLRLLCERPQRAGGAAGVRGAVDGSIRAEGVAGAGLPGCSPAPTSPAASAERPEAAAAPGSDR